ncbi:MAG: phosphoribosylaminoimidazolesuccinocarboxamide synthase [Cenarchaeum sp. SB0665_bin_23]|nr:phosphoribosylaminoimidazolesuccinocarboxamide synthase [Cenarchaeum sp. SB0667_bin_13]MXY37751.1 phosphoribosylaminoimidazolesuccinocarboxamide synthase [Cenarchaeum sp. SB0664_bin_35]MXY61757.1 phosphoribosylaminoimidazolesuccinocarboxamide synthase [Cenarchaeum sp. SB0665_bin_23]MXZ93609.1 phosphoribosylaminoimidazolesuccinocarboxamide synthase [Cenarchaeum sp. SB0666_bin_15]MYB46459.1 phosphoribosylaminoimidazolesuccinocarboxamide synthase [Cenarchaeum sp. SB0662_bin_33]MYC80026.1 phosp
MIHDGNKPRFLNSGKVKDVYDMGDDTLMFRFSDRVSAFDVKFHDTIYRKGEILCKFAQYWFENLRTPNHFVRRLSNTEMLVKKMNMIPLECVVRGYLYGSLVGRFRNNQVKLPPNSGTRLASRLGSPMFDPTTKSEHDMPVSRKHAIESELVTAGQYDTLYDTSISVYETIAGHMNSAGFILADLKLEFGISDGQILLGDSIGPDEYRLWSKDSYAIGQRQDSYDKQILRDWLEETGWKKRFQDDLARGVESEPPDIPPGISKKITARYISSYTTITGLDI